MGNDALIRKLHHLKEENNWKLDKIPFDANLLY